MLHCFPLTRRGAAASLAALVATPALADPITLTPTEDVRLRYEHVEQDGIARAADAVTIRVRSGVVATSGPFSALVEAQGNLAIVDHYDDTVGNGAGYPAIGDPENIALYRAQLQYKTRAVTLTGGRQRIALEDERFVGQAAIRQNSRSFDAVRTQLSLTRHLRADLTYAWSVRTPSGINGTGAKPTAIGGDNVFALLAQDTPLGVLTGFAYLVDQDEAAVQGYRLSSQSYGARLAGSHALAPKIKASWQLSYATQSDYHRNPNDYRADYYLIDGGLDLRALHVGAGYEVLGAGNGTPLTSFQTPLSSIFRFQGWADKLTTTPPNGVRDLYGSVGWAWPKLGAFKAASVQAVYHRFDAERVDSHYGNEVDLLASAKLARYGISARFATYWADRFATDTRKLWLELTWAL
ncbi:hypothetical protein ACMGDM_14830 [Sphingomonas sp. DT-51]|uniref:hypothetical protein n=1 Tax=Sphingomonas sp. DT-51 TaxID=3396165 RepID=UPI003F1ACC56